MYQRFRNLYNGGQYVGRPRALPHFLVGLGDHKDDFRRMVRALNYGLAPEHILPYQVFYDKQAENIKSKPVKPVDNRTPEQIKADRNHRRNVKRRNKRRQKQGPTVTEA